MKLLILFLFISFNLYSQNNIIDSLNIDTTQLELTIQDTIQLNDTNIIIHLETDNVLLTDTNILNTGNIIYDLYDTLYVDEEKIVKIAITKDISIDSVISKMKFENCITEKIRIERFMQIEILNLNTEKLTILPIPQPVTQTLEDGTFTHWEWILKSTKPGKVCFIIKVRAIVNDLPKNLLLYKYNVISISKKTITQHILGFFLIYWQWLIATLILPVTFFIWKLKTTKK